MSYRNDGRNGFDVDLMYQLYERMSQGVIYCDTQGKVVMANPAAEQIMGMASCEMIEETMDKHHLALFREDGSLYPIKEYPPAIALHTGVEVKNAVVGFFNNKDRRHLWLSINSVPIYKSNEEEPFLVCSTFTDITEYIQVKNELREALIKEKDVTRVLQCALKPDKSIRVDGYEIAVRDIPAFNEWTIGGDIYDSFRTKDGKVGILIGDASGKGIIPTSFAMMSRNTTRAFCYTSSSAAQSLILANEVLCDRQKEHHDEDNFMTLCVLILDPITGHFQYSNAGHPPPAIWHSSSQKVDFLPIGKFPLGLDLCDYQNVEGQINPGDKLLLYTDGLTEARKGDIFFEEQGIQHYLNEYSSLHAEELLGQMCTTISAWSDDNRNDDITMILVERSSV